MNQDMIGLNLRSRLLGYIWLRRRVVFLNPDWERSVPSLKVSAFKRVCLKYPYSLLSQYSAMLDANLLWSSSEVP